jgi:hypothetical protein
LHLTADSSESLGGDISTMALNASYIRIDDANRRKLLVTAGCVMGLLPLLQAHSFFGVGILTVVVALMDVSALHRRSVGSAFAHRTHLAPIHPPFLSDVHPSYLVVCSHRAQCLCVAARWTDRHAAVRKEAKLPGICRNHRWSVGHGRVH